MLTIRGCEACRARIRTTARASTRPGRCLYCKAALPVGTAESAGLVPTRSERAVWNLGLAVHGLGIVLPLAVLLGHRWFAMDWLGGGLVGAILAFMLHAIGWGTRVGTREESVGLNVAAMALALVLVVYGFAAFPPLDGLGGASMVLIGLGAVILSGSPEVGSMFRERADQGWFGGWFILLGFLVAYAYHAARPWLGE